MKKKEVSDINFVKDYEPDKNARVELKNGRIADVINAGYYDENIKLILRGRRIVRKFGIVLDRRGQESQISI